MSDEHSTRVAKVITIIGSSPHGFAEAAAAAVEEASRTLRGIKGADVVSMSAEAADGRITEYRTTVNIAFGIERSGGGGDDESAGKFSGGASSGGTWQSGSTGEAGAPHSE